MNYLIFTVGSKEHGMGHVVRCLVLAEELRRRGHGVDFVTAHETPGLERIRRVGHRVTDYHPLDFSWAGAGQQDVLVIDHAMGPSRELLELVRPHYAHVVVISAAGYSLNNLEVRHAL